MKEPKTILTWVTILILYLEQVQVKNSWWSQIEQLNLNHLYSAKLCNFALIIPKLLNSGLFQKGYLQSTNPKYTPAQPYPKHCTGKKPSLVK